MPDFKPPKPNRAVIWLSEFLLPLYLNLIERISFQFFECSDRPTEFLKGKPVVIVVNHSDRQDPLLVVALAKYLREDFYCVAAREVFDWNFGALGWLFQRFGCFSVDRGTTDFRSIHTIQKILIHGDRKFIVFPEGEVTGDDQFVHEISSSLMHIFLKTQSELADGESPQSIWILPVGVSYRLETGLQASIDKTLSSIERQLDISCNQSLSLTERTTVALDAILRRIAESDRFVLPEKQPQHERALMLARHICQRISTYLGIESDKEQSCEQVLHVLRRKIVQEMDGRARNSRYVKSLRRHTAKICSAFLCDLDRVERLLIVHRVLNQKTSPIQLCRIVDFMESEVFGRMTAKGRQRASVFFGEPIEVLPYLQAYNSNKESAVSHLSDTVRNGLQLALDNSHRVQPLNTISS